MAQKLISHLEKKYALAENQKSIKKFHSPFVYRGKETPLWKYYLTSLSYSNILVNKIIKFDLRYFKDAMVDTLIPLNYGYFHYQNTIMKFLNLTKKKIITGGSFKTVLLGCFSKKTLFIGSLAKRPLVCFIITKTIIKPLCLAGHL